MVLTKKKINATLSLPPRTQSTEEELQCTDFTNYKEECCCIDTTINDSVTATIKGESITPLSKRRRKRRRRRRSTLPLAPPRTQNEEDGHLTNDVVVSSFKGGANCC